MLFGGKALGVLAKLLCSQGGHVGLVWGWLIPCPFVLCVAASLAELTSSMPYVISPYIHHFDNRTP